MCSKYIIYIQFRIKNGFHIWLHISTRQIRLWNREPHAKYEFNGWIQFGDQSLCFQTVLEIVSQYTHSVDNFWRIICKHIRNIVYIYIQFYPFQPMKTIGSYEMFSFQFAAGVFSENSLYIFLCFSPFSVIFNSVSRILNFIQQALVCI